MQRPAAGDIDYDAIVIQGKALEAMTSTLHRNRELFLHSPLHGLLYARFGRAAGDQLWADRDGAIVDLTSLWITFVLQADEDDRPRRVGGCGATPTRHEGG